MSKSFNNKLQKITIRTTGKQGEYEILNLGNETTKNKQTCECGCYLFDEDGLIVSPLAGQCMDYKKIVSILSINMFFLTFFLLCKVSRSIIESREKQT